MNGINGSVDHANLCNYAETMFVNGEIIYIMLLTLLASVIGTLAGFGISTIMVPVLLFILPLPQTLLLAGIVHWFNDVWKLISFREGIKWKFLLAFDLPGLITSFVGSSLSLRIPRDILSKALGIFGIGGEINAVALSTFNLEKAIYIATAGAISFVIDSTRIATYIMGGTGLEPSILTGFWIFVPVSFIGAMIGKKGVERIPQEKFRNFVAVFIFIFGLKLVLFP